MPIPFYVVLRAGRAQFGILAEVSFAYLTLCIHWRGPHTIWDFGRSFYYLAISLYFVLRVGCAQFGILEGLLVTISLYVVLDRSGAGCAQFRILEAVFSD